MENHWSQQRKSKAEKLKRKVKKYNEWFKKKFDDYKERKLTFVGAVQILEAKDLNPQEKIFFFHLFSLSHRCGYCWAHNEMLCEKMNRNSSSVSSYVTSLENKNYITTEYKTGVGGKRRIIYINFDHLLNTPGYDRPLVMKPRMRMKDMDKSEWEAFIKYKERTNRTRTF